MLQNSSWLSIDSVDPNSLSHDDIASLAEVTQDMWADGIWEFVQCIDCDHMHSKKDIYGHLSIDLYSHTVRSIMWDFEVDNIACQKCSGKTKFIFGKGNIEVIKDRLQNTRKAFLVIVRTPEDSIAWFEDAYIDTLPCIFHRECETHYKDIGIPEIQRRISQALWYHPIEFLALSDIGLLSRYRNLPNLTSILHRFAQSIDEEYDKYPGFTEIDQENILSKISRWVGGISLWIQDDPTLRGRVTNVWREYKSDLTVYHEMGSTYKKYFTWSVKGLISIIRSQSERLSS
jgi:hypothetical protein